jgi:DNA-binding response OmpR family regulator
MNAMRRSLRILLADDERDTTRTLAVLLEDEGHVVHQVNHGSEVLRTAHMVRPDAIVLDIQMPGKSGYALAEELKALYYGTRTPMLVAISGKWTHESDRILAQRLGFDHYLAKPANPQALVDLLAPLAMQQVSAPEQPGTRPGM